MNTYVRQAISFVKGNGAWLETADGTRYLDGISGIAVNGLGYAHAILTTALTQQLTRLTHVSNLYQIQEQENLAKKLCQLTQMDKVFFCNSGCEAIEASIKIARAYGHSRKIESPQIIVMENAFHGRTLGALSATGNIKTQEGFEPLLAGFIRAPFDDIFAVEKILQESSGIVAILVEPIQGEGGINIPKNFNDYLLQLRQICDRHQCLLILDEIQTGMGRTGKILAFQHTQILPDVIALAKGLGNGFPVGACLARGVSANILSVGKHGSTFGGNPLAMTAGLTTLQIIEEQDLCQHAQIMGDFIAQKLKQKLVAYSGVISIRHMGLMIGITLDRPCQALIAKAIEHRLLINVTAEKVIRLLPPLILNQEEANYLVDKLVQIIKTFLSS